MVTLRSLGHQFDSNHIAKIALGRIDMIETETSKPIRPAVHVGPRNLTCVNNRPSNNLAYIVHISLVLIGVYDAIAEYNATYTIDSAT
jgi:hypothetical protein